MINYKCSNCGTKLTVSDDHVGKKAKCPKCGDLNTIPPPQEVRSEGSGPMTQVSDVAPASSSGAERGVPSQRPGRSRTRIWLALIAGAAFLVIIALVVFWWLPAREEGRLAEARESASQLADDQCFRQVQTEAKSALLMQALGEAGDADKARKAYRRYLEQYSNGRHSSEARKKLDELDDRDNRAFAAAESRAKAAGDDFPRAITAYRNYLQQYPNGHHLSEARKKLDELDDRAFAAAESRAKAAGDDFLRAITAYKKYLAKYPHGRNATVARERADVILPKQWDTRDFQAAEQVANAVKIGTQKVIAYQKRLAAYQKYLATHPKGEFSDKAKKLIQEIETFLKSIPQVKRDYQGKTGLDGPFTRSGLSDLLLMGRTTESLRKSLLVDAGFAGYTSSAPAVADVRVTYGIMVRKVPRKLIEVCVRHARYHQKIKMEVGEKKNVLPDNWLARWWVGWIQIGDEAIWDNFNKSSRAKFPELNTHKVRIGLGGPKALERMVKLNATLEVVSPASVRAYLRTRSLTLRWLFVDDTSVGSQSMGTRDSTSLGSLLERFDPDRTPSEEDCDSVAEEIIWSKELGIGDGTYASLPQSRRILQAWLLEAMGFTIGNPADSDTGKGEKAIKRLDEAKAEFTKLWEKAEAHAKSVLVKGGKQ